VFIVSINVESNCHILQFLHQMFNVSSLVLDDALLKMCLLQKSSVLNCCNFFGPPVSSLGVQNITVWYFFKKSLYIVLFDMDHNDRIASYNTIYHHSSVTHES